MLRALMIGKSEKKIKNLNMLDNGENANNF